MNWQDEAFVTRVERIKQRHQSRLAWHSRIFGSSAAASGTQLGRGLSLVSAVIIGSLAVLISRYAMFQTQGLPNGAANPGMVMIIDALFAFCIAFVIRMGLNMTSRTHFSASIIGVFIALTSVHNLVHAYPDAWAKAFSQEWVTHTTQMTEPKSLYIQGHSFEFMVLVQTSDPGPG